MAAVVSPSCKSIVVGVFSIIENTEFQTCFLKSCNRSSPTGLAVNDKAVEMTSFGETTDKNAFFTGKPMIDELGYSFLFRDYNPNQGKWTTSDPIGYPDGWNNLAYVNNKIVNLVDFSGGWATIPIINVNDHAKFFTQNRITYEGMTLNSEYFEQLKRSNYLVDGADYQGENNAFMHAMKRSSITSGKLRTF